MKITVCIGSSCHLKGSIPIIEELQRLVERNKLKDKIELCGAFCMGDCVNDVSVKIDEELFSVKPDTVNEFFENEVMKRI